MCVYMYIYIGRRYSSPRVMELPIHHPHHRLNQSRMPALVPRTTWTCPTCPRQSRALPTIRTSPVRPVHASCPAEPRAHITLSYDSHKEASLRWVL
jgi:hypothetical protein